MLQTIFYSPALLHASITPLPWVLERDWIFLQVIVGDQSHVYQYEAGGMSVLGGVAFNVIPTQPNGELALDALEAAVRQCPVPSHLKIHCKRKLSFSPSVFSYSLLCMSILDFGGVVTSLFHT